MRNTYCGGCLTLALFLGGCGADMPVATDEHHASLSQALTDDLPTNATDIIFGDSVVLGACRYTVGTATLKGPPFPPPFIAFVQRSAVTALCERTGYQLSSEKTSTRGRPSPSPEARATSLPSPQHRSQA